MGDITADRVMDRCVPEHDHNQAGLPDDDIH
jgi:hypothetical protein